jgi:hypothetical protein
MTARRRKPWLHKPEHYRSPGRVADPRFVQLDLDLGLPSLAPVPVKPAMERPASWPADWDWPPAPPRVARAG